MFFYREAELFALLSRTVRSTDPAALKRAHAARNARRLAAKLYTWRYEAGLAVLSSHPCLSGRASPLDPSLSVVVAGRA